MLKKKRRFVQMKLKRRDLNSCLLWLIVFVPLIFLAFEYFLCIKGYEFKTNLNSESVSYGYAFMNGFSSISLFEPFTNWIKNFFVFSSTDWLSNYWYYYLIFACEWSLTCVFVDLIFYVLYSILNFGKRLIDMFNSNL